MPIIFTNGKLFHTPSSPPSPVSGANGGYQSPKIIDPSLVLPQALLGGEDSIEALHWYRPGLSQEEVQKRIWEGWNLELDYEGVVARGRECRMQVVLSFQAALEDSKLIKHHYVRAIQYHEEYVKCELVKMIRFVESALDGRSPGSGSGLVLGRLIRKKDGGVVKSLEESVGEGDGWKVKGNLAGKNRKHEQAIRHYLEGLISLWPYTSSDTSMSYEQAHKKGLVKLEQALLNNIITISLSHPSKTGPKRITFDNIARVVCEVTLEFRYLTITNLRKTFERLAQLDEREHGIQGKQGVNAFMAELFKGKDGDGWVHRNCNREHVCHE